MNNPKGTRRRLIQLKFYVNEKELKKIKKRMKVFDMQFSRFARLMCMDGFIIRIDDEKLMEHMIIESKVENHIREFVRFNKYRCRVTDEDVKHLMEQLEIMAKSYGDLFKFYMDAENGIFRFVDAEEEISDDEI